MAHAIPTLALAGLATLAPHVLASRLGDPSDRAVVTETYTNLGSEPLAGVPVSFSRVGCRGDFTAGITPVIDGVPLPAQVDVLARHADDSIRHALVSFVLPRLGPEAQFELSYTDAPPPEPEPFRWVLPESPARELVLELTDAAGRVWRSRVRLGDGPPGSLPHGGDWADPARVLVEGPVLRELELHDLPADDLRRPHGSLDVFWRLRQFTGEASLRVELVVEASRLEARDPSVRMQFEGLRLLLDGSELLARGPYEQLDRTRFRLVTWTDGPLEQIHRRPNVAYLERGHFIPPYRPEAGRPAAGAFDVTAAERQYLEGKPFGLLMPGVIHPHMPGTGGRPDIGPYPGWALAYLHSGSPALYRALLHADGNGGGAFPIHLRGDPWTAGVHYKVDRRAVEARYKRRLPQRQETQSKVAPDQAHAPSLGYLSYILTGERYYAEELSFWASYQLAQWPWVGLDPGAPERTQAWGLRHLVDAAFLLPDAHPLKSYFTKEVDAYANKITALAERDQRGLPWLREQFRISGRPHWVNCMRTSPWQYAWVVWSLGNAVDKGFASAELPRDWTAAYIVGLYTSDDEFVAPDGKTYRFDPRDAMQSNLATSLFEYTTHQRNGQMQTQLGRKLRALDNYGEVWYWTKVNCDNAYSDVSGLRASPDRNGAWPLDDPGWGHGRSSSQSMAYNWNRYGAWVGLVAAVNGEVEGAERAWKVMTELAGAGSQYGFNMLPRSMAGVPSEDD